MTPRFRWWRSSTIWGAAVAGVGYLSDPSVLAVLPKPAAAFVTVAGVVISAVGARKAVSKNGNGI